MRVDPQLKGHTIATIFEVILIHAGYYVIPIGVERTNPALRTVDRKTYMKVSERLRSIPDFFYVDPEEKERGFLEVKFRQRVRSSDLLTILRQTQSEWSPFVLILAVAQPPEAWKKGEIHHIRAFHIHEYTDLDLAFLRNSGRRLQDIFHRLKDKTKWKEGSIVKAEKAILRIAEIE